MLIQNSLVLILCWLLYRSSTIPKKKFIRVNAKENMATFKEKAAMKTMLAAHRT
jgi:hypothetical protein